LPYFSVQVGELKLGELLDSPPPGLDEAIAISKVRRHTYYLTVFLLLTLLSAVCDLLFPFPSGYAIS
jgi:hypothetical protein